MTDKTIVVKYGGHAMVDRELSEQFRPRHRAAEAGRDQPDRRAWRRPADRPDARQARDQEPNSATGLRVTDEETMDVVEMVLAGSINKADRHRHQARGRPRGRPFRQGRQSDRSPSGSSDADRPILENRRQIVDLGFVGEPAASTPKYLDTIMKSDIIPVIAPIGVGADGETYNINADTVGGRRRRRAQGQAPAAADRCRRRARQGQAADHAN